MKFKKGFTLAEILIVLMVIGVLATLTIPSLMKGVQEAQYKTAYRKAFNNISNIMAAERTASGLPGTSSIASRNYIYEILQRHLSIKAYVSYTTGVGNKKAVTNDKFLTVPPEIQNDNWTGWIIAEDGLSYNIRKGDSSTCGTKEEINAKTSRNQAKAVACAIIVVDVNGLTSLPNKLIPSSDSLAASDKTPNIGGDQFYIYIGTNGAAAGNSINLHTGRIVADIK